MKCLFSVILLMVSFFSARASPQATLKKIPKDGILVTEFTQSRHFKSLPSPLISTGHLKLWPQKGLIWITEHPFSSTLMVSKTGLYQIENDQPKALKKAQQNNILFKTLSTILAGEFFNGLEGFDVTFVSQDRSKWHVKLIPQNPQIKNLITALSIQGHQQVQKVTIHRANGDYDDIVFTNHQITSLKNAFSSQQLRCLND